MRLVRLMMNDASAKVKPGMRLFCFFDFQEQFSLLVLQSSVARFEGSQFIRLGCDPVLFCLLLLLLLYNPLLLGPYGFNRLPLRMSICLGDLPGKQRIFRDLVFPHLKFNIIGPDLENVSSVLDYGNWSPRCDTTNTSGQLNRGILNQKIGFRNRRGRGIRGGR